MSEIMKIIESIKKIDEEIRKLNSERDKLFRELQSKIHELLEEEKDSEMSIKCIEEIITKAPQYNYVICAVKSEYGIERIEEYYKDSSTLKLIKTYKVLIPEFLTENILKFISNETNKNLIVVSL